MTNFHAGSIEGHRQEPTWPNERFSLVFCGHDRLSQMETIRWAA